MLVHAVRAPERPRARVARGVRLARADASTRPLANLPRGYPRSLPPAFARGPSARPRRSSSVVAPSAAAAPAVVASAATTTAVPEMVVAASVGYLVASFVAFWLGARNPICGARYTRSPLPLVPLCVAYPPSPSPPEPRHPVSHDARQPRGWTHLRRMEPPVLPEADGIMTLLSRRATSASVDARRVHKLLRGTPRGSSRRSRRMARVPHPSPHPRVRSRRLMFALITPDGRGRRRTTREGDAVWRGVRRATETPTGARTVRGETRGSVSVAGDGRTRDGSGYSPRYYVDVRC